MKISEWAFHPGTPETENRCAQYPTYTAEVLFGTHDSKGRALGCRLDIEVRGSAHYTGVQAQRDSKTFGASFPMMLRCETLEEAKASLLKRAEQSRKRALKNAVGL